MNNIRNINLEWQLFFEETNITSKFIENTKHIKYTNTSSDTIIQDIIVIGNNIKKNATSFDKFDKLYTDDVTHLVNSVIGYIFRIIVSDDNLRPKYVVEEGLYRVEIFVTEAEENADTPKPQELK